MLMENINEQSKREKDIIENLKKAFVDISKDSGVELNMDAFARELEKQLTILRIESYIKMFTALHKPPLFQALPRKELQRTYAVLIAEYDKLLNPLKIVKK